MLGWASLEGSRLMGSEVVVPLKAAVGKVKGDWVLKALLGGLISAIVWQGHQMTSQLKQARVDLAKHTTGMYDRMDPMFRVANALAVPEGRDGKMRLFVYLDKVDAFEAVQKDVRDIKTAVDRMEGKLDKVLPPVGKGR